MDIGLVILGGFVAFSSIARLVEEWRTEAWINRLFLLAFALLGIVTTSTGLFRMLGD